MTSLKPKNLTGSEISVEQAQQKAKEFFGSDKIASIEHTGDITSDTLPAYNMKVTFNDRPEDEFATLDISKKGGHVIWMLYNRETGQDTLDVNEAKQVGMQFLKEHGYNSMKDTYYVKEDSVATINYAYQQDGVVIYPDLIKVKVALDTGEIVGFESKGFIMNHTKRQLVSPALTEEQARARVNGNSDVKSVGLAVIPTKFGTEIFCYEIKGKLNDKDFLVYINAATGKEEQVLIIIDTENGILTM
jgi:germination protein YpeB